MLRRRIIGPSFPFSAVPVAATGIPDTGTATGLVSYWPFSDASGTAFNDAQGGHHGTLNATTWGADYFDFQGGAYGSVADHADFNFDTLFTCFFRVNAAAASGDQIILCQDDWNTPGRAWTVSTNAALSNKVGVGIIAPGGALIKNYKGSQVLLNSTWNSFAFRWNVGVLDLFVNGIKDPSVTKTTDNAGSSINNVTTEIAFGAEVSGPGAPDTYYTGFMRKVRFYNIAKSDADILAIHTAYT